jgi:predicted ATPase/DNA-binding SARP family transcriptional activator
MDSRISWNGCQTRHVEVGILGPLTVEDGGRPIEVGGARLRALLIRLAASAGGWVPVSALIGDLWGEDPPADEINALQSLVSRLRRALIRSELVESGPAGYRLAIAPESVDAIRFERLTAHGRRRLTEGDPQEASAAFGEALRLWRGAPLAEVADATYAVAWIERLDKLRLSTIDDRADAGLKLGRHADLVAELDEVAGLHPLRERTHELLIRALAGSGRQAEALAAYEQLRRALAEELGLDPPLHLQQLQTAVLRDSPDLLAPTERLNAGTGSAAMAAGSPVPDRPRRTNLRSSLTSFVGRELELLQLAAAIKRSRLVTLVGTGGAGKTRLASEAAGRLSDQGTDGVWMIQLAPVTDPDDVASTALGSIGTLDRAMLELSPPSHRDRDALSRLVESLGGHDVVLILDNCEHLIDAAAKLAEHLLGLCPKLTVIATSREPLGIVGESLWPVLPLATPKLDDTQPTALETPAVRLFVDRVALVRSGFAVTPSNADAVAEICRRLDGLPLAIELAAARLRTLSVEAVAARLGNRFRLLTGGNRTAMPRHQTLRAVVAWSWELLTENERSLAEQLSVFPGGATVQAAAAICSIDPAGTRPLLQVAEHPDHRPGDRPDNDLDDAEDLDTEDPATVEIVADLLASLADKSLLVVVEASDSEGAIQPRYRMLETIREFANERLADRGEPAALRAAHARYFRDLAERAEPQLRSSAQLIWLDQLTAERDNLLAALRYAADTSDADTAIRIGAALSWYWTLLGRHDEAATWLDLALKVPGPRPDEQYLIVLAVQTLSAAAMGLQNAQPEDLDEILQLSNALDLRAGHPLLTLIPVGLSLFMNDGATALTAITGYLDHPDPWARACLHMMSAMIGENDGDIALLEKHLPLALQSFQEIGDRWGIGASLSSMGILAANHGDIDGAIEFLTQSRLMMTELRARGDEAHGLLRVGMLRLRQHDLEGARRDMEESQRLADESGVHASMAFSMFGRGLVARYEGDVAQARILAEQALAVLDQAPFAPPQIRAVVHCALAHFDVTAGALDAVIGQLAAACDAVRSTRDMPVAAMITVAAADYLQALGEPVRACELIGAGVAMRGMEDASDLEVARVRAAIATVLSRDQATEAEARGRSLDRSSAMQLLESTITTDSTSH